ncbi:MAG: signal recognition particle-docking protein FtsY [Puniceicoccales bacterium]|jgi:fused signal recognition particle receptor|nr:signal recognition particle-docking protein FtsY [Puniceicoccales bacterium]
MFKFFKKLSGGVRGATGKFFHSLVPAVVDENSIKTVEDTLLSADFGTEVTRTIVEEIRIALKRDRELRWESTVSIASKILMETLAGSEAELDTTKKAPQVICLVGANGSGKTTTAAKLAYLYKIRGKKVLLGSCDTFRAAANEQLNTWGERLAIDVIASQRGADPAAVAFDAYGAAVARGKDILILDTAGRLHVKANLMAELRKIFRVLGKAAPNLTPYTWLVVDGTIGTNAIESAKTFHGEIGLSGTVVTKLDGTSSGGALVGIYKKLRIPIYFIGTGETPESLEKFSAEKYVSGLFFEEG